MKLVLESGLDHRQAPRATTTSFAGWDSKSISVLNSFGYKQKKSSAEIRETSVSIKAWKVEFHVILTSELGFIFKNYMRQCRY